MSFNSLKNGKHRSGINIIDTLPQSFFFFCLSIQNFWHHPMPGNWGSTKQTFFTFDWIKYRWFWPRYIPDSADCQA